MPNKKEFYYVLYSIPYQKPTNNKLQCRGGYIRNFFTAQIDFPLQIGYTVLREGLLYAETI